MATAMRWRCCASAWKARSGRESRSPDAEDADSRVERLASGLASSSSTRCSSTRSSDMRYLSGFTGSHGALLVVAEAARARLGRHRFLSDFRYTTQSAEQVR